MRCLIDQPVSWLVDDELRHLGFDAVHVREMGLGDADDPTIMNRAKVEERILVTQDTDFGTLLARSGDDRPSVIPLRVGDATPHNHGRILRANLNQLKHHLQSGVIVVIGEGVIRVRRPPI